MKTFKEITEMKNYRVTPSVDGGDNIPSSLLQRDKQKVPVVKDLYWKTHDETGGNLTPEHLHNIITKGNQNDRDMSLFYHAKDLHPATSQHIADNGSLAEKKTVVRENDMVHPDTLHSMLHGADEPLICSIGRHPNCRDATIKAALDKSNDEVTKANIVRNPNIKSETLSNYISSNNDPSKSVSVHSAMMALKNKSEE